MKHFNILYHLVFQQFWSGEIKIILFYSIVKVVNSRVTSGYLYAPKSKKLDIHFNSHVVIIGRHHFFGLELWYSIPGP
jgi:hypothetical protein